MTEPQGTHSLTYSLTHLTTYSLTHSLTQVDKSFYGCLYDAAEEVTVPRQSLSSDNLSDFNLYKDKLANGDPTMFERVYKAFERVALPMVASNESLQSMSPRSSSPRLNDMASQDDLASNSSSNDLFKMFERAASQNNLYNSSNNLEFLAATSTEGTVTADEGENKQQQLLYRLYYAFEAFLQNYNDAADEEEKMDNKFMDKVC
jgi:hypothetical protein